MGPIFIYNGPNSLRSVHHSAVQQFLPNFRNTGGIDLLELARIVGSSVGNRNRRPIWNVMKSLFGVFRRPDYVYTYFDNHIAHMINNHFDMDMSKGHFSSRGLSKSRLCFTTLAALAAISGSLPLAQILLELFLVHSEEILNFEREEYFINWASAIAQLNGLAPPYDVQRCLQCLACKRDPNMGMILQMMDPNLNMGGMMNYDHGRNLRRSGWPGSRALTPGFRSPQAIMPMNPWYPMEYQDPQMKMEEIEDRMDRVEDAIGLQDDFGGYPYPLPNRLMIGPPSY
jgi:hypothetical protein